MRDDIKKLIEAIDHARKIRSRVMVAIAGSPASGKSTLAEKLWQHYGSELSVVVPMDGFHLDNSILELRNLRDRKGAPETFDVDGFISLISRIVNNQHSYAPKFDRQLDASIAGAIEVSDHQIIIVEGNYLLLTHSPWDELAQYWDISAMIKAPREKIKARLIQRWIDHGFSESEAFDKMSQNDLINAELVIDGSRAAMIEIKTANLD